MRQRQFACTSQIYVLACDAFSFLRLSISRMEARKTRCTKPFHTVVICFRNSGWFSYLTACTRKRLTTTASTATTTICNADGKCLHIFAYIHSYFDSGFAASVGLGKCFHCSIALAWILNWPWYCKQWKMHKIELMNGPISIRICFLNKPPFRSVFDKRCKCITPAHVFAVQIHLYARCSGETFNFLNC